jgi:hypothetical protein
MRKQLVQLAICVVAVLGLAHAAWAVNTVSEEHAGLRHVLQTDYYQYTLSDSVHLSYSMTNVTDETMHIEMSTVSCPIWVCVFNPDGVLIWCDPMGCTDEAGWRTLLPGASFSLEPTWDMMDCSIDPWHHIDEPGIYTVEGHVAAMDPAIYFAIELQIEIVDASSVVPEDKPDGGGTWGHVKALYR